MQNEDIIKNFSNKFNCDLTILENGEHYFHTEEQLKFLQRMAREIVIYVRCKKFVIL